MAEVDKNQLLTRAFSNSSSSISSETESQEECETESHVIRNTENVNNYDSHGAITKRYLVYMELPKIKIGDYHKSSCVVGNILRFHFLMKISENEDEPLVLLPIKAYKVPVVNVAVIHRPFIEDDTAKGPIPKSPDAKSPLIRYSGEDRDASETQENLADDFRKGSATDKQHEQEQEDQQQQADDVNDPEENTGERSHRDSSGKHRHGGKKRKKYFVYCELPKVALGDYRISSVTSSELIHCHFLLKIAKDETNGQPVLRPIKKYRRPRVNFAVIHRALIVDDEAAGPIPRSPGVKSPMIREDMDGDDDMEVLHATMGFNYGTAPRSKYELMSQWSLVADESGRIAPELVLSKTNNE